MSNKTRGALALVAAGALTLTMAPQAFASLVDDDPAWNPAKADMSTNVHRIANNDRISTAIEASQYRTDWGKVELDSRLRYNAPGTPWHNVLVPSTVATQPGVEVSLPVWPLGTQITATTYYKVTGRTVNVIVARSNDFSDALAATPLADVLDAPVLINPTDELDARVEAEIKRLQAVHGTDGIVVHLLGGTNALSHDVENAIDEAIGAEDDVDNYTLRYQGIDRYETAVNIALRTVINYGVDSDADIDDINVYLTTGKNFPDALAAGAAAAQNDGVVLLTNDEKLDTRGFTDKFLIQLDDWVDDDPYGWDINTTENFAVGGQATRASIANDIRIAKSFDGRDRYETATLTATGTFKAPGKAGNPAHFAVVSGETYADALVASAFIANADGPLLLTKPNALSPVTAAYLEANAENTDHVWTFGGPGAMALSVTNAIKQLLTF